MSPSTSTVEPWLLEVMNQGVAVLQIVRSTDGHAADLICLDLNHAAREQTGLSPEAVIGRSVSEFVPPSVVEWWLPRLSCLSRSGGSLRVERFNDVLHRWYDVSAVSRKGDRVAIIFDDITARKHAEEVLCAHAASQSFLIGLGDTIRPLLDPVDIQRAAARVLADHLDASNVFYAQYDEETLTATVQSECVHGALRSPVGTHRMGDYPVLNQIVRAGGLFVTNDVATTPVLPSGERASLTALSIHALAVVGLVKQDRLIASLAVTQASPREWTPLELNLVQETAERTWAAVERARAETELRRTNQELETRVHQRTQQLAASNESLKALFRRLVSAQEDERQRIARDLHDELGQQITALRMDIEGLRAALSGRPAIEERVERTLALAEELDASIDFLTRELRPTAFEHLGLCGALRELVDGWSRRFSIEAEFEVIGTADLRLERDAEANLYRLTQEALHNVLKHAGATHVTVLVKTLGAEALLIIEDNGCGFVPTEAEACGGGLGLPGMRERAALAGGTFEIESVPGQGTSIYVRLPAP